MGAKLLTYDEDLEGLEPREPTILERRVAASQWTLDHWRKRSFSWEDSNHCARMCGSHLRKLGRPIPRAKAGSFKSALQARAALKRLGHANLGDLVSAHFQEIPPAAAIAGDLVELESADGLGAVMVCLGNGRVLGYIDGHDKPQVLQPLKYGRAWNVFQDSGVPWEPGQGAGQ